MLRMLFLIGLGSGLIASPVTAANLKVTSAGAVRGLIAQLERARVKPIGCFVGEPTEMNVVIGHKSKLSLRVTVKVSTSESSLQSTWMVRGPGRLSAMSSRGTDAPPPTTTMLLLA